MSAEQKQSKSVPQSSEDGKKAFIVLGMLHDPYRTFVHRAGMKNLHGCKEVGGVKKGLALEFIQVLPMLE